MYLYMRYMGTAEGSDCGVDGDGSTLALQMWILPERAQVPEADAGWEETFHGGRKEGPQAGYAAGGGSRPGSFPAGGLCLRRGWSKS